MHTKRTTFRREEKIISFVPSFLNFSFYFILLDHSSQVLIPHAVCLAVLLSLFIVIRNIRTVPSLTLLTCTCISFVHYLLPKPSYTFLLFLLVVRPTVNPIPLPSFLFFTLQNLPQPVHPFSSVFSIFLTHFTCILSSVVY
jgi:hypothetical protein